jgi:glycosyltransferase involved in cell wall biosynthesis
LTAVSAIICTRNRPDLIGRAVASVLDNDYAAFDLTVVDQSTDDATEQALRPFAGDPRLHYHHIDRAGLSHAYNYGIRNTGAPLLAFTDDDCVAPRDWLSSIVAAFERHPDVGLIYGQTIAAPELQAEDGTTPDLSFTSEEKIGKGHGFRVVGMGADFALRRGLIDRIGGFDEALGGGGPLASSQDFDFQYRVYQADAVCLLAPDVWVHHYGIRNWRDWPKTLTAYGVGDGAFYMKHVRCRDLFAIWLTLRHSAKLLLREIINPLRRQPAFNPYFRGYFEGIRRSLKYEVNRKTRLYELTKGTS